MTDLKDPAVMGKKIYKYLQENKIVLLQDKSFPNIVTYIVGRKIKGSWWGHPLANPIYNGLNWLEKNKIFLSVKLIDGKVTYLHKSLISDFYSIVKKPRDWQLKNLKEDDLKMLQHISQNSIIFSDDETLKLVVNEPKKNLSTLEKKLLIHSVEVHTSSGMHVKKIMTWKNSNISCSSKKDYLSAKFEIEKIVFKLCEKTGAKVKLPW